MDLWLSRSVRPCYPISVRDQTVSELSFENAEDAMDFVAEDLMYDKSNVVYDPE